MSIAVLVTSSRRLVYDNMTSKLKAVGGCSGNRLQGVEAYCGSQFSYRLHSLLVNILIWLSVVFVADNLVVVSHNISAYLSDKSLS